MDFKLSVQLAFTAMRNSSFSQSLALWANMVLRRAKLSALFVQLEHTAWKQE
jgi:hypothetical protein